MIGGVQMTVEMTRSWWMLGKASSSQSPIASKRLFGSTLSVDCQSVFHLRTSFSRDLGNEMSFSQHAFYFIIKLWPDKFENFPKRGGGGGGATPPTLPLDPPLNEWSVFVRNRTEVLAYLALNPVNVCINIWMSSHCSSIPVVLMSRTCCKM